MTIADIADMPVAEKLQLMESLWESLSQNATSAVPEWHGEELASRGKRLDQGLESISPWNEAKQRIHLQIAGQ